MDPRAHYDKEDHPKSNDLLTTSASQNIAIRPGLMSLTSTAQGWLRPRGATRAAPESGGPATRRPPMFELDLGRAREHETDPVESNGQ